MEHLLRHCEQVAVGPYSRDALALAHEVIDTISAGVPPEQLILPWMSVKEGLPDAHSGRYVCAYTPAKSQDRRYQLVSAAMFRTVCRDATHWFYMWEAL